LRLVFRRHAAIRFCERLVYGGAAGAARIKYIAAANERNARLNFTRSLLGVCMRSAYAVRRRIRDAKMQRRKIQQRRKQPSGAHETNRKSEGAL